MGPEISVVMPVFNRDQYIGEAIGSILSQTFTNFELIIVDDCSTDNTLNVIESFNDNRILVIKNEVNMGQAAARNVGYRVAKGKYIANADSDDINLPHRLEKQLDFLEKNKDVDVVGCWYRELYEEETRHVIKFPISDFEIKANLLFNPSGSSYVLFRKGKLKKKNMLYHDETFKAASDYLWYSRLDDDIRISIVPEVLFLYRRHRNQISTEGFTRQQEFAKKIRLEKLQQINITPTDVEYEIHLKLSRSLANNLNNSEFIRMIKWCEKIVKANEIYSKFDKESLEKVLSNRLIKILNNEYMYSHARYMVFKKSRFFKYIANEVKLDQKKIQSISSKIATNYVFVFGTKRLAYLIKKAFNKEKIEITNFIDNNEENHFRTFQNKKVIPMGKHKDIKNHVFLISILSKARFEVKDSLINEYGALEKNVYLIDDLTE